MHVLFPSQLAKGKPLVLMQVQRWELQQQGRRLQPLFVLALLPP
jgi:hypothetical protein